MKERRKHCRVPIHQHAWIYNFEENASPANLEDCLIVDISESGACIQCSARYQEGQPIAFTYQDLMEDGLRPVVGVVMWSRRHSEREYRHGVKFLGLSTQTLRRIQRQVVLMSEKRNEPGGP
nr:PilZ domain-containing protein [uncultured Oscillibacter sp.]